MKNPYAERKYIIIGIFLFVGILYVGKLFYLQIINKSYTLSAQNNVLRLVTQYPARGLIYDRNGELMVYNEAAYDLMLIPRQMKEFDTLALCALLDIDMETFMEKYQKIVKYSRFKASVFEKQISKETYGYLEEMMFKFPGFFVQTRSLRNYAFPVAAHTLGYVGEVSRRSLEKDPYYRQGDYIGNSGLEYDYEKVLRGEKGVKRVLVDVFNREKGSFQDGLYDTVAVAGKDIQVTLDAKLQAYGELLMTNKKGSIVALEPATGEILALVTSPAYDPNLLVGRVRSENYKALNQDTLEPLFNRALAATYPPGSTFKLLNALIALQEGAAKPSTTYSCEGRETRPIRCSHSHTTPVNMYQAIEISCNPYFWKTFRAIFNQKERVQDNYNMWRNHVLSFGFGNYFDTDLFNEAKGFIPKDSYYSKYYGERGWRALTIRSLSIGQGEILSTPLQMANFAAIVANGGYYYLPHLVKSVDNITLQGEFNIRKNTTIDPGYFDVIIEGMHEVFEGDEGTARWYKVDGIAICGKTGTAENPHGKDHSIFIAFAPKDDPKIAVATVVETSGFGSTWAVPITTLMIERYLTGTIKRPRVEEDMINGNLILGN